MMYFARHGESEANVEMVFSNRGFMHPLTEKGIVQARSLAELVWNKDIRRVLSSPILRAVQTASIVSNELGLRSFEVYEDLREYDVGRLEGKSDEASWGLYFENERKWKSPEGRGGRLPDGESYLEVRSRFSRFVAQTIQREPVPDQGTLVISHGGLLKIGLAELCANIDYAFACDNPIRNCELIACSVSGDALVCRQWGSIILM